MLEALRAGKSIGEALEVCAEESAPKIEQWFAGWSEQSWLCVPEETADA